MINMKNWMLQAMESSHRLAIPIMTHPGIELSNLKVIDAVTNGQHHFEAIRQLNETYPADACTVIMDLTVEAEAFGAEIIFPENEVPSVVGRLVTDYTSVKNLQIPSLDRGRLPEYLKANRLTAEYLKDKPLFGGGIGPYSLAGRLYDMTELMMAAYTEPETVILLLEKCTEFIINYCKAIKETGANGIIIAEPAAGLLSNEDCVTYSSHYIQQIVNAIQDDYFMVVLHNCGNTGHCTRAMLQTGAMACHFGNKINILDVLEEAPSEIWIMGNLDPVGIFKMSSAKELKKATLDILNATSGYKNYVLSTGCDVPPHIPLENINAFYEALYEYNKR